ncbi:hypothetical protein COLO4_26921 [Corchorus olitorius]|uniref:Uncharacterized protein n=1 Tax=Corchorus olitorius TaxID=93759 RepID=A0A1R3HTH8_9ROSI|nr:hypothetical protein COLO4_26921 [Corchorus olitorius]
MAYETAAAMQGESLRKGPWHEEEDERLITFVKLLGSRRWDYVARVSENFQFGRDNGRQLFLFQGECSSVQNYNAESYKPCDDILDTENRSNYEAVGQSDFNLTSSPYETRLSDWISEFPSDQSEIISQEDCNSTDSCYCYPSWVSQENDLWGCSDSLWNME